MRKQLKYIAGPLLVVGLSVLIWQMWPESNDPNFPEGTDWICTNAADRHTFTLTMDELAEHTQKHYGERPKCPTCGKEAIRAEKCGHCGKVYPQARGEQVCPFCKKPQVVAQQ